MELRRLFTTDNQIERENLWTTWTKKDIKITDSKGNITFEMKEVEVPTDWSGESCQIFVSKYFKKINGKLETSIKSPIKRVVKKIVEWFPEYDAGNQLSDETRMIFADELTYILSHQMCFFNSPVWFNFGVPNRPQTASACFLLNVEDTMDSIRDWLTLESKIFQAGSGCFVGETEIFLADGSIATLKDLYDQKRQDIFCYSSENGLPKISKGLNVRLTKYVTQLCHVEINDKLFKCTPDHKFLMVDGSEKAAIDLLPGDSLLSLNKQKDWFGYEKVRTYDNRHWYKTHWLADEYNMINNIYKNTFEGEEFHRHHINHNPLDNSPTNIVRILQGQHLVHHGINTRITSESMKDKWANSNYRETTLKSFIAGGMNTRFTSENMKERWSDENYRSEQLKMFLEGGKATRFKKGQSSPFDYNSLTDEQKQAYINRTVKATKERCEKDKWWLPKARVLKLVKKLIDNGVIISYSDLNEDLYNQYRKSGKGSHPFWFKAIEYFGSIQNIYENALHYRNHEVTSVKVVNYDHFIPVYDLVNVKNYNNFAIVIDHTNGIFVHNSGVNISNLRAEGSALSAGGTSSGPLSFMLTADTQAKVIKSGGSTRRAARIVHMNYDHPDIEKFIVCKVDEEKKAHALIKAGYNSDIDGEAYGTVAHQTANYSVRVDDQFMQQAINEPNSKYQLLLNEIAKAAWSCGDPGLVFTDKINEYYTIPDNGYPTTTNPCQPGFATILTPEGIKTFDDIEIGSIIWSGKQWTKITNKQYTGEKPVYKYHTTVGEFIGTEDHKVFSNGIRCKVGEAEEIDISVGPVNTGLDNLADQDIVDGWVFGDGSVHKASNNLVYLTLGENDNDFFKYFNSFVVADRTKSFNGGWEVKTTIEVNEIPYTYNRSIPNRFLYGAPSKVRGFLVGLYSANGSIVDNRIQLKASSFDVIQQVQMMLSSLGISSYYTTNKKHSVEFKNGIYECKQSYDLNITKDRKLFAKLIGFRIDYKNNKLNAVIKTTKTSCKPSKITYQIVSKEFVGVISVYDITVECDEHSYWTAGLLVSNCIEVNSQPDFSACNLASLNLLKFWDAKKKELDIESFWYVTKLFTIAMDIIVGLTNYPDERIAKNSINQRHIGLGFCNLGGLLLSSGISYDSDEGRLLASYISSLLTGISWLTSTELAEHFGAFTDLSTNNKKAISNIIRKFSDSIPTSTDKFSVLRSKNLTIWSELTTRFKKYGLRNANVTLTAPTGTVGLGMGAATLGLEPEIGLVRTKNLVGGGVITYVNPLVEEALQNLGYSNEEVSSIKNYIEKTGNVIGSKIKKEHVSVFATAYGDNALSTESHIKMTAAVQKFVNQGCSKTINVPKNATVADVCSAYIMAWKEGLKSISIYRDGSKGSQPIEVKQSNNHVEITNPVYQAKRRKMDDERPALIHKASISGFEFYITVGLYEDGAPGEVFINASKEGSVISNLLDTIGILLSYGLQYGIPLDAIVDKLKGTRSEPSGFTHNKDIPQTSSIIDYVVRWLEQKFIKTQTKYIIKYNDNTSLIKAIPSTNDYINGNGHHSIDNLHTNGVQSFGMICKNCGGMMIQSGTCSTCSNCATTSGGCG